MKKASHFDTSGKAKMVDVGNKKISHRSARAAVKVHLNETAYAAVRDNAAAKGDVLAVAKLAGIQAAKKTPDLIPLCHHIPLNHVEIDFHLDENNRTITIHSHVTGTARTGVEMEALTACSITALTIYDMLKALQRDIMVTDLLLLEKKGGESDDFSR